MRDAEWILTFDDGPLPADLVRLDGMSDDQILAPLRRIITTLREHPGGSIPAVFFLRGPDHPWPVQPPKRLYEKGVAWLREGGHRSGLHCYNHSSDLWWDAERHPGAIHDDLAKCTAFFEPMLGRKMTAMRPPYGQDDDVVASWASAHGVRVHCWDVDTEDWLHHADATVPCFGDDPSGHLAYVLDTLPAAMQPYLTDGHARDILLHVSIRTAQHLPQIIERIMEVSKQRDRNARFVLPSAYLAPGDNGTDGPR